MINYIKTIFVTGSVLDIRVSENTITIIDNSYTIFELDANDLNIKSNTNVTTKYTNAHKYTNASSISGGDLAHIGFKGIKSSMIVRIRPTLKKLHIIKTHTKPLESAVFSHDLRTLATGGIDGKVFIHDAKTFNVLGTFDNRPDYIASLKFSSDDSLLVSNCFNKTTSIYNMDKDKRVAGFATPDVVEDMAFLEHNEKMYFVCRNGASIIYNFKRHKIEETKNLFAQWPTTITLSPTKEYGLVGTRTNKLIVVNIASHEVILTVTLKHIGINKIKFLQDYIIVGYIDGAVDIIDYSDGIDALTEALDAKDYPTAKDKLDENIFLKLDPVYTRFADAWVDVLKKCAKLLSNNMLEAAIEYAAPFLDDKKRAEEFDFYAKQQDKVTELQRIIDNKEFIKGFAYAEQYPYLKKMFIFEQLENHWKKVFNAVRKLIEEDPVFNKPKAEEMIKPYFKVAIKKELVVNILTNFDKFSRAEKLVKAKEFGRYFKLVKEYSFLEGTAIYEKVQALGARLFSQLLTLEQTGNIAEAASVIKIISGFPEYKERVKDIVADIKYQSKFTEAVSKNNKKVAYDILSKYEKARYLPSFESLHNDFIDVQDRAKESAFNADVVAVKKIVSEYLDIEYTQDKAASFIKIAYLQEFSSVIDSGHDWNSTILKLIGLFGKTNDIEYACKQIPDALKAYENIDSNGNQDGYKTRVLPDSII